MIFACIVAGGSGLRMSSDVPKQYIEIMDKPIIIRTVEKFLAVTQIDKIYIGCSEDYTFYLQTLCESYGLDMSRIVVAVGGADRNGTVFAVADKIIESYGDKHIFITHDGVRPFVTSQIITENINAMKTWDSCGTYLHAVDTIVRSQDGKTINEFYPREEILQAQTPQTFKLDKLISAYQSLTDMEKSKLTDTCSVMTAVGEKISIVGGSPINIKITKKNDLLIAKAYAQAGY